MYCLDGYGCIIKFSSPLSKQRLIVLQSQELTDSVLKLKFRTLEECRQPDYFVVTIPETHFFRVSSVEFGNPFFIRPFVEFGPTMLVDKSLWIEQVSKESFFLTKALETVVHYVFFTPIHVIECLSGGPPKFEVKFEVTNGNRT